MSTTSTQHVNKDHLSAAICQLDMKDEEVKTAQEICANCGKAGSNLNICNKCNEARYCNAICKKKHKKKHKAECEEAIQRATELHEQELKRAAELHDIELFKQPPTREDCPICFALLPCMDSGRRYWYAVVKRFVADVLMPL